MTSPGLQALTETLDAVGRFGAPPRSGRRVVHEHVDGLVDARGQLENRARSAQVDHLDPELGAGHGALNAIDRATCLGFVSGGENDAVAARRQTARDGLTDGAGSASHERCHERCHERWASPALASPGLRTS